MHSYLSVVLVELTVMVMRMDTGTFDTKLKSMVSRVAAEVTALALHCLPDYMFNLEGVAQDR